MNLLLLFVCITAVTVIWRYAGLTVRVAPSPFGERFLRLVPISIFTALAVMSFAKQPEPFGLKFVVIAIAGVVAWRTRQFGVSVLVGLAVWWVLSSLTSG